MRPRLRTRRCRRGAGLGIATSSRWKSRSSFTSGLLARSTDAQPLNAPSPSVPVRPLIITTEPLSRTSALADSGACNRPGASQRQFDRNVLPLDRGRRRGRLDLEFQRMLAGARAAGDRDLAVAADHGIGVDALDAVLDAVAQIGKHDGAVGDLDAIDGERIRIRRRRRTSPAWRRRRRRVPRVRSRRSGTYSTGRTITSSVTCGWPDHTLASVMSAWMLPTVRRLPVSRSFGSCSVTSFSVTFSDGHRPILVAPAIVSR